MSVNTLRNRASNGTIQTLNLASATASDRRFEVELGAKGADKAGTRFFGFEWVKTTAEVVTVTVSKVDTLNSDKEYVIEGPRSDLGELTGLWEPSGELVMGHDPEAPGSSGWKLRLQFSQAGGACAAHVNATIKAV